MPTNKKQPAHGAKTTPAPSPMSGKNSPTSDATAETPTPNTAETSTAKPVANRTPPRAESDSETSTVRTTQRITALEIENFKGIGRPVRLDLRPITLLFGRNSAGKSTILHAFCYANEILNHNNLDADTTSVGGDNVRLGGFANLIHDHDATQDVRLRFDLDLENWCIPSPLADRVTEQLDPDNFYSQAWDIDWFQEPVASAWVEIVVSASQGKPKVTSYEVGVNDLYLGRLYLRDGGNVALETNGAHPLLFRPPLLALEELDPTVRATLDKLTSEIESLTTAGVEPQEAGTEPFDTLGLETKSLETAGPRPQAVELSPSNRLAQLQAELLRLQKIAYGTAGSNLRRSCRTNRSAIHYRNCCGCACMDMYQHTDLQDRVRRSVLGRDAHLASRRTRRLSGSSSNGIRLATR